MRLRGFGDGAASPGTAKAVKVSSRIFTVADQRAALTTLRDLAQRDVTNELIRTTAVRIITACQSRDDECELNAIFHAVKEGRPDIPGLENGLKYVADPNWADLYTAPHKLLELLISGVNGGDCDDHAALICALGASVGFTMGLLAYGPPGTEGYTHVLAVAKYPKREQSQLVGLDTTVPASHVGWLPPYIAPAKNSQGQSANVLLAWLQ